MKQSASSTKLCSLWKITAPMIVALSVLLSGCAFTTGHVAVGYEAAPAAVKIAEPESPHVAVKVTDKRTTKAVGQKVNGFGMKTADIVSDTDIPETVKNAFQTELSHRGFTTGPGGNTVDVELNNFQNQFTLGFFSGDAIANVGMNVMVRRSDGSVAYTKYVTGNSKDWVEIAGEGNAERQLNLALQDAISKVFTDPDFIGALKK